MNVLVRAQNLTRHYRVGRGTLRALDGVSFEVAEGETLGIVGESGCGKSTLAKILVGIDRPTSGAVILGGLPLAVKTREQRKKSARLAQLIFQDPFSSLNPRLRVGAIVGEPLIIHGAMTRDQRDRKVRQLLHRVGLPRDCESRFPHEFSGGQRQRIGIARALALSPKVLVADEPTSALDVSVQAQILNLLADLRDELGLTLILVSHDLQVVEWMSDRVMVMYLGRAVEVGPAVQIFDTPAHPYTQALLAAAPSIDPAVRPPVVVDAEVPSALTPPSGCHFHPRCPLRQARCETFSPTLEPLRELSKAAKGSLRLAACHEVGSTGEGR